MISVWRQFFLDLGSMMLEGPEGYIAAKNAADGIVTAASPHQRFIVDGRPYFPSFRVHSVPKADEAIECQCNDEQKLLFRRELIEIVIRIVCGDDTWESYFVDEENQSRLASLRISRVMGGNTNALFLVSNVQRTVPEIPNIEDSYLVRIFGGEGMIDRDFETAVVAALSDTSISGCEDSLGPSYYGRFGNGRLEGWFPETRALTTVDFRQENAPLLASAIATELARLHTSFRLPSPVVKYLLRNQNQEQAAGGVENSTSISGGNSVRDFNNSLEPSLWIQLGLWLQQAMEVQIASENPLLMVSQYGPEIAWLRTDVIHPLQPSSCFCHNDLLSTNILVSNTADELHREVKFIDFEYCGYNYASFDIANHFNEYAGGTDDGTAVCHYENMPTPVQQKDFIRTYLRTFRKLAKPHQPFRPNGARSDVVQQDEVEKMYKEVQAFIMVNHLYWGLWAVNASAIEGCDSFDYLKYASQRFAQYWQCKREFTNNH
jgi:ethanolamine kinase